ncbi:MAG TPA: IS200/IS605 family transposase, partial [Blastocatellia bacterium]|nr:IS200/IS605 family transposase [Blastocatellia bacterium]
SRLEVPMPSTHTSLHYHLIFSTKDRARVITEDWRGRLHAYMGGIVKGLQGVPLEIGGVEDHVHLLVGLKASHRLSDVLRDIKGDSSTFAHQVACKTTFAWQPGYAGFTVSRSQLERVAEYIRHQEEHHRRKTFQEEYVELLKLSGVEYKEEYLW